MQRESSIVRERQLAIRRQIDRRGIALKAVAMDSGISYSTLLSYFPGERDKEPAQIPGGAIFALCEGAALPADLLSLLLPDGWQIVRAPEAINHDAIADWAEQYQRAKLAAHRADSEMAEQIGPNEHEELTSIVVAFPSVAA